MPGPKYFADAPPNNNFFLNDLIYYVEMPHMFLNSAPLNLVLWSEVPRAKWCLDFVKIWPCQVYFRAQGVGEEAWM